MPGMMIVKTVSRKSNLQVHIVSTIRFFGVQGLDPALELSGNARFTVYSKTRRDATNPKLRHASALLKACLPTFDDFQKE